MVKLILYFIVIGMMFVFAMIFSGMLFLEILRMIDKLVEYCIGNVELAGKFQHSFIQHSICVSWTRQNAEWRGSA